MKSITSKRFVSVPVFLVLSLLVALILAGAARSGAPGNLEPGRTPERIQMFDIGSGSQAFNFQLGRETKTQYLGAAPLLQAVQAEQVEPRAMVSDDFNGDGMGDLVVGYANNGSGVLGVRHGNLQAIAPTDPEVFEGIQNGRYPSPFLPEVSLYSLPEAPDFLQVGDFNADGHSDVMAGARGGQRIYLFAGDGRGHLGDPEAFDLPGLLTAMQAGREQLGRFTSLAIGLLATDGARFSVYREGGEGLAAEPETHTMPSEVTALAFGDLNQDGTPDLAAAAGNEVAVVYLHEEITIVNSTEMDQNQAELAAGTPSNAPAERTTFPFVIRAVAAGNFAFDRGHQIELALLADDGAIHLVDKGQPDTRAFSQREIDFMQEQHRAVVKGQQDMGSLTREMNKLVRPSSRFRAGAAWNVTETLSTGAASPVSGAPGFLQSARMSGLALDDLLVGNAADNSVQVVKNKQDILKLQLWDAETLGETASVKAEGAPLAAVSMRLGVNTHPGIVILQADKIEPLISVNSVTAAYVTTTFTDFPITPGVGGVNVNTGAIVGGAGNGLVSLRSAIIASNYKGGSNSISLSNGTYTLTQGPFDDEFNTFGAAMETGDLDIIDLQFGGFPALTAVTLTGAGRDTTIIQMGTLSPAGAGGINKDRVLESNNFVIPQHGTSVTLSNLTIQNGNAPRTPAPDNYNTKGGGIQFDGFDSPTNTNLGVLTLTNCKFTANTSAGQGGGILAIFGGLTVQSTSIVSSNTSTFAAGGGIQHSGGNVITTTFTIDNSTIGGPLVSDGNTAGDASFGSGGVVDSVGANAFNITNGTVIQNNTAGLQSGSNGGGGVHIGNSKNIVFSNSTISSNKSKHNGGGIWVSARDALTNAPSTITLTTMNVTGNQADSDNTGAGDGGGLFTFFGAATVQTASHIDGNSAVNGGGIFTGWSGIAADPTAGLTVNTNSTIGQAGAGNGNSAKNNGGSICINPGAATTFGTINLTSLTFTNSIANSDNSGTGDGGAIFVGNGNLTSWNACTIDSNVANGGTGDGIRQTGGTITCVGTINVNGGDSISISGGTFTSTGGTLNLTGNFINSGGSFVHNSGTVVFNGTGAQSLGGTTSSTFNNLTVNKGSGTLTLGVNTTLANVAGGGNLSVSAGTFDLATFTINRAAAGGTLTLGANTLLKIGAVGGTNTLPSNYSTHSIDSTSTVEYAGANQSVAALNSSQSYGFLTTSGSGTKTLAGAISVANDLTIGTGTILDVSASNFAVNVAKNWTNNAGATGFNARSGLVTFNGSGGTQTLTGNTTFFDLTLNNSGATTNFGSTSTTISRNLATTAGTMDGGASTITFTGNPGAISGASAKNFNNLVVNGGAVISNTAGGNTNITNDYTDNGTFTQGAGLTTTFSTGSDGSHSLSGSGTTTFGNVTIISSNTVDAGAHNFNVVGASFTVDGIFTGNSSTVTFNGGVAQAILGNGTKSFSGLTINNVNGVTVNDTTPAVDASVGGLLTLTEPLHRIGRNRPAERHVGRRRGRNRHRKTHRSGHSCKSIWQSQCFHLGRFRNGAQPDGCDVGEDGAC